MSKPKRQKTIEESIELINHKIDDLLAGQGRLETQVATLMELIESRNTGYNAKNKAFAKVIKVFKSLIIILYMYICTNFLFYLEIYQ